MPDIRQYPSVGQVQPYRPFVASKSPHLPKLRDRVALDGAVRDAVAKLDPSDIPTVWAKSLPEIISASAVIPAVGSRVRPPSDW